MDAQQANEILRTTFGQSWFWFQQGRVRFLVHPTGSTKVAKWWVDPEELPSMTTEDFQSVVELMQAGFAREQ